ncbi:MAG: hypothetical protein DMG14_22130 [Acidobacteria bacterium]|nr:MAG: hypothetical protein DMG14_22130 [Acidobacteriota bacterium]
MVAEQLETFLTRQQERDRPVPQFVEREFRSFLDCGILARGFLRLRCESCGHDRLLAFSCKRRIWCPSCAGRRMADTAAHLVPALPAALPHGLRRASHQRCPKRFHSRSVWRIAAARSPIAECRLFAVWRRCICAALRRCPQCQTHTFTAS